MRLILVRHGNTFEKDDVPVWVGANEDLPLTKFGLEQAENVAACLKRNKVQPLAIYTAGLQRTKKSADIIAKEFNLTPIVDERLREIDYADWGGKSNQEIIDLYGEEMLKLWTEQSRIPPQSNWKPDLQTIREETRSLVDMLAAKYSSDADILIVSSNGRLRYYLDLIPEEFNRRVGEQSIKMATGNLSCIQLSEDNQVVFWNQKADGLQL